MLALHDVKDVRVYMKEGVTMQAPLRLEGNEVVEGDRKYPRG